MTKLERQTQKIFGVNAPADDIAALGSFKSGTPVYTDDISMLQNEAYEEGYGASLVANEAPFLEEQNSIPYILSKQLAYLYQNGIAEWDANTTYYANTSFCQINGIIYQSLTDNNLGNNPATDKANWQIFGGGSGASLNIGETVFSLLPLADAGLHLLDGSLISGTGAYSAFVTKIAQLYGNGSNVPAYFTTETLWQQSATNYGVCGKFVYDSTANTVRLPKVTGIVEGTLDANALGDLVQAALPALNSNGEHTHTRGTQNITGSLLNTYDNDATGQTGSFSKGNIQADNGWGFDGNNHSTLAATIFNAADAWTGATSLNGAHTHTFGDNIGVSDTVQPQTVKGFLYIVIATSVKTDIEVDIDNIATDLNGKADIDLSNVNALAESSAVAQQLATKLNQTQVTNCILEIPQTINCTLSNGTVTLKSGSRLIFPYGREDKTSEFPVGSDFMSPSLKVVYTSYDIGNFTVWAETQNDISFTPLGSYTGNGMMSINPTNGTMVQSGPLTGCRSGLTDSQSGGDGFYFDTTNYTITHYSDNGGTVHPNISLPFIQVHRTSGSWDIIEKTFNGIGYIGGTVWIDKGVKGVVPNGRNDDGTLKNITFTTSTLNFSTLGNVVRPKMTAYVLNNGTLMVSSIVGYDESSNMNIQTETGATILGFPILTLSNNNGVISNFNPYTSLRLLDANELTNLSPTASKDANGYIKFANGVIIQWGRTGNVSQNAEVTVTLPIAFSSATSYQVVSASIGLLGYNPTFSVGAQTSTNFQLKLSSSSNSSGTHPASWIAIGY